MVQSFNNGVDSTTLRPTFSSLILLPMLQCVSSSSEPRKKNIKQDRKRINDILSASVSCCIIKNRFEIFDCYVLNDLTK